jgi:hypothetical protein
VPISVYHCYRTTRSVTLTNVISFVLYAFQWYCHNGHCSVTLELIYSAFVLQRLAVLEAFQRMYGVHLDHDLDSLLHMPNDGDTWSVMQSWVLPTRSFLEFVMFSRYGLCFVENYLLKHSLALFDSGSKKINWFSSNI